MKKLKATDEGTEMFIREDEKFIYFKTWIVDQFGMGWNSEENAGIHKKSKAFRFWF